MPLLLTVSRRHCQLLLLPHQLPLLLLVLLLLLVPATRCCSERSRSSGNASQPLLLQLLHLLSGRQQICRIKFWM